MNIRQTSGQLQITYLGCSISSNMNCCQKVKQSITMANEAFSRKRSIFCRSLRKELRKSLVKFFLWSVALYGAETWTLRRNERKRLEAFEMWIWRRLEHVKWPDKHKKGSCARKSGRRKNNAGTYKEVENKLARPLAKRELPAEGCSRRNDKRKKNSRQKKISDDCLHYDKWTVCRYEKEG